MSPLIPGFLILLLSTGAKYSKLMNERLKVADETNQSLTGLFIWKPLKAMHQESGWNAKVFRLVLQNNAFIIHSYISRKVWTEKE